MIHHHPEKARAFVQDDERAHWHDKALWFVRVKRDRAAATVPEWEQLRGAAEGIKVHTLSRLADYLEEFERKATANGIQVHWARDGEEHNRIVHGILEKRGVKRMVKSKSMLTEEAVSCMMGRDRIADHVRAGAEVIAGYDMSCLMHLDGLARRDGTKLPIVHVAEMLEKARLSR